MKKNRISLILGIILLIVGIIVRPTVNSPLTLETVSQLLGSVIFSIWGGLLIFNALLNYIER